MQQGEGSEAEVTWEDQLSINKFSNLNNRLHELEDEIKAAKSASRLGRFSLTSLGTRIEQMKEVTMKNLDKLEEEKEFIVTQMAQLKVALYAKFKNSINLEEDQMSF